MNWTEQLMWIFTHTSEKPEWSLNIALRKYKTNEHWSISEADELMFTSSWNQPLRNLNIYRKSEISAKKHKDLLAAV